MNVSARHISSADASLGNASFFIILHITLCKGEALRAFGLPNFRVNENISVPNRQNTVQLIFGKNELGAFSESLRPPLSIAGSIMILAGL